MDLHSVLKDLPSCVKNLSFFISRTLLLHGLESDWIEEEMADDDDFRLSFFFKSLLFFSLI